MERKDFIRDVAELCRVNESEIASLSQRKLVDNYILPKAVEPTGQDTRGWRISPQFMQFMAGWGQYCVREDRLTGEILMEIAMQRLSCGAIVREIHENKEFEQSLTAYKISDKDTEATKTAKKAGYARAHIQYMEETSENLYARMHSWFALPEGYREYSNWYDQQGLMDQECWNFFKSNMYFCMTEIQNPVWRGHARKLCAGLIQHLNAEGKTVGDYMWNEDLVKEPLKEVYAFALECANRVFGVQSVAKILLPTWRSHKEFFKKYEWEIDFPKLFEDWGEDETGLNIEVEGECYYGKWQRRFLKLFRVYKSHVEAKVKAEMLA